MPLCVLCRRTRMPCFPPSTHVLCFNFHFNNNQSDLETLSGVISVGSTVKVLVDYRPVRDDEIGVSRGDLVQVAEVNPNRGYKIRKQHATAEGWVPTYVLNLLTGGPRRPAWTFKKFRKPSFSNRKDSSGKLVRFTSSKSSYGHFKAK